LVVKSAPPVEKLVHRSSRRLIFGAYRIVEITGRRIAVAAKPASGRPRTGDTLLLTHKETKKEK
jgi:hypothetical protein